MKPTEVNSLPSSMWDAMFPLDAQWPATTNDAPADAAGDDRTPPVDRPHRRRLTTARRRLTADRPTTAGRRTAAPPTG